VTHPENDNIKYRISRAHEIIEDITVLMHNERLNACASPLYYVCFNIISALFIHYKIVTKTHSGLKSQFNLHFVKTGIVDQKYGKLLEYVMNLRQESDYADYIYRNQDDIEPLIEPVKDFIRTIEALIYL
jgi:uncharacterized protein (UPF0332 family)